MILGFAHLMVGVVWDGFDTHYNVTSSNLKWPFMRRRATNHKIAFLNGGLVPIEMVCHDTGLVNERSKIRVEGHKYLHVLANDASVERDFFSRIGNAEGNLIRVRSQIKQWNIDIYVKEHGSGPALSAPIDPPLDLAGYAALAFFSNDVENDRNMLVDNGGRCETELFEVNIGGKRSTVCLLRSPEGVIVELVQVHRRS